MDTLVDLHPTGFQRSFARALHGNSQVGWAEAPSGYAHAFLWYGTAASAINLHPEGYLLTVANGVSGKTQIGGGRTLVPGPDRALAWRGSAQSVVDLHEFLPPGFQIYSSIAEDIDQYGNIIGSCGEDATGLPRAVVWMQTSTR
jgi:hypothetical protein